MLNGSLLSISPDSRSLSLSLSTSPYLSPSFFLEAMAWLACSAYLMQHERDYYATLQTGPIMHWSLSTPHINQQA